LAAAADLAKVITGRENAAGEAGKPGSLTDKKTVYMPPRNKIQETIGTVWQQFFGTDPIGMEDNFFDMGATSLDIIQVNNKLNETLAMEIPVAAWFRYPTIQSLTTYLNLDKTAVTAASAATAPAEEDPNEKKRAAKIQQGMKNSGERRKLRQGDTTHD
jgi:acyl carrier protein